MKTFCHCLQHVVLIALLGASASLVQAQTTDTGTTTDTTTDTTTGTTTGTTTTASTATGVFIYELKFDHVEGFNVDFWGGGYVIVPSLGGTGSAILTATDNGRRVYSEQTSTVAFYPAKSDDKRYSIVSMGGGTAGGSDPMLSMQAFGEVKHPLQINGPGYTLRVKAAKTLHGMAQAARDESKLAATAQPHDGTLSFIEFAEMKLVLDEDETAKANKKGGTVASGYAQMLLRVQQKGYVADSTTTTGGGTTGGGTTGGTTTTPGIDTGTDTTVNPP